MPRHPRVDGLRGAAILMMVAFHVCYDLTYFGYAHFRMLEGTGWIAWRNIIVGSFVFLAGWSLALSQTGSRRPAGVRDLQLAGCAALVSLATWVGFGPRWIYFGVLHFFLVATLLTRPLLRFPRQLGLAGAAIFLMGWFPGFDSLDPRWINWLGLAAHKPQTEDYAPLIPWLGLLWMGVGWGDRFPGLAGPERSVPVRHFLPFLGRHSLAVYMLHQPMLFGLFLLGR